MWILPWLIKTNLGRGILGAALGALFLLSGYLYVGCEHKKRVAAEWDAATARGQLEVTEKKAAIDKDVQERKEKLDEMERADDAAALSDYFNRGLRQEDSAGKAAGDRDPR